MQVSLDAAGEGTAFRYTVKRYMYMYMYIHVQYNSDVHVFIHVQTIPRISSYCTYTCTCMCNKQYMVAFRYACHNYIVCYFGSYIVMYAHEHTHTLSLSHTHTHTHTHTTRWSIQYLSGCGSGLLPDWCARGVCEEGGTERCGSGSRGAELQGSVHHSQ